MIQKLKITRIVTSTNVTPFNKEYYDGMTIQQAADFERGDHEDSDDGWREYFFSDDHEVKTFVEILEEEDTVD